MVKGSSNFAAGRFEQGDNLFAREVLGAELFFAVADITTSAQFGADEVAEIAGKVQRQVAAAIGQAGLVGPQGGVVWVELDFATGTGEVAKEEKAQVVDHGGSVARAVALVVCQGYEMPGRLVCRVL